jgi:hypothetical protein
LNAKDHQIVRQYCLALGDNNSHDDDPSDEACYNLEWNEYLDKSPIDQSNSRNTSPSSSNNVSSENFKKSPRKSVSFNFKNESRMSTFPFQRNDSLTRIHDTNSAHNLIPNVPLKRRIEPRAQGNLHEDIAFNSNVRDETTKASNNISAFTYTKQVVDENNSSIANDQWSMTFPELVLPMTNAKPISLLESLKDIHACIHPNDDDICLQQKDNQKSEISTDDAYNNKKNGHIDSSRAVLSLSGHTVRDFKDQSNSNILNESIRECDDWMIEELNINAGKVSSLMRDKNQDVKQDRGERLIGIKQEVSASTCIKYPTNTSENTVQADDVSLAATTTSDSNDWCMDSFVQRPTVMERTRLIEKQYPRQKLVYTPPSADKDIEVKYYGVQRVSIRKKL